MQSLESPLTLTIHFATLAGIGTILGILFKQHRVWVRMKDRLNSLWKEYCIEHKIEYERLDNGK